MLWWASVERCKVVPLQLQVESLQTRVIASISLSHFWSFSEQVTAEPLDNVTSETPSCAGTVTVTPIRRMGSCKGSGKTTPQSVRLDGFSFWVQYVSSTWLLLSRDRLWRPQIESSHHCPHHTHQLFAQCSKICRSPIKRSEMCLDMCDVNDLWQDVENKIDKLFSHSDLPLQLRTSFWTS